MASTPKKPVPSFVAPTKRKVRMRTPLAKRTDHAVWPDPEPGRCNAKKPGFTRCRASAGARTDHRGTGPCWVHDTTPDSAQDTIQRYRGIRQASIAQRLRQLHTVERNVLDMIPDVQLARALLINFVENYEELTDALLAWYRDRKQRPASVPDLASVISAVEAVSRVVERVHKVQSTGAISLDTFRRILEQMGVIVARHVTNATALDAIEREWATVVVDSRRGGPAPIALPDTTTTTQSTGRALAATSHVDAAAPPEGAPVLPSAVHTARRRAQAKAKARMQEE